MQTTSAVDWADIDTVLLDMDGTLLDLRFDNWFWQSFVPARYAQARGCSEAQARGLLEPMFHSVSGTLPWYCIDHWTRELQLDIRQLTRAALHRVGYLPRAVQFLRGLNARGKRIVLVTNAHPDTLAMKSEWTRLRDHVDACYSSHAFEAPKEQPAFWPRLLDREYFAPQRTLFIDDSLPVLNAARAFGIAQLRAVRCPDSKQPRKFTADFAAIDGVADLVE